VRFRLVLGFSMLCALVAVWTVGVSTALGSAGIGSGLPAISTSTSPGRHAPPRASASVAGEVDPEAITFDEYPLDTTITDQYADHGVVFTSDVFTSVDGANPTAPVLSGTPQFFGDIDAKFTVPGSTTPTTVDGFSLDVGYINNRNSVEIQYFDAAGSLVGSTRAQSYGINHIEIPYRGVASFTVKAVSTEIAGFAIDNLLVRRAAVGVQPLRMAELGDSYSSGEGLLREKDLHYDCGTDLHGDWYREGTTHLAFSPIWEQGDCQTATGSERAPRDLLRRRRVHYENLCHRNGRAYPNQIRERLGVQGINSIFVACSGAETKNVGAGVGPEAQYPDSPPGVHGGEPQLETVQNFAAAGGPPELITIGIGGNDAGFGKIVERCIVGSCANPDFVSRTISTINGTMFRNVRTTLETLRADFPAATIVAFGYPSVIDDPGHWCKGFLTIGADERSWLKYSVLPTVNDAIKDAAAEAGVVFADITPATTGHGVCSPDEWINGARLGDDSWYGKGKESFHPNQKGHDAITTYFIDHYTDGAGHLLVKNPDPAPPIRPDTGPEIRLGSLDAGAAKNCGANCLQPAACVQTCSIHVHGDGYAPGVAMAAVLQSSPVSLGQVVTDPTGAVDAWFRLPRKIEPGLHSVILDGVAPDGTSQEGIQIFRVFARVSSNIAARFARAGRRGTRVRRLSVRHVASGTRVDVVCGKGTKGVAKALAGGHVEHRGGCPFAHRAFHTGERKGAHRSVTQRRLKGKEAHGHPRRHRSLALARYFKRPLAPGTMIRVVVTHHGRAGKALDARMRAGRAPKLARSCVAPSLRRPGGC
jgi:lysophospholipase L1-like esterase